MAGPLVSCIMPTADRRAFVPRAVAQFLRQDYPHRELVVLDDGRDPVGDLMPSDPRVRYLRETRKSPVGVKRNQLCEAAHGDLIVHWDDDDWMADRRVSYQARRLLDTGADLCGLDRVFFYDPAAQRAWEYVYPRNARPWLYGATLCYTRAFWRSNPFPPLSVGEDSRFVWSDRPKRMLALDDPTFFLGVVHAGNTSPKRTQGHRWLACPVGRVLEMQRVCDPTRMS